MKKQVKIFHKFLIASLLTLILALSLVSCEDDKENVFIAEAPIADFVAALATVYENQSVNFTDTSNQLPSGWQWTFDGGVPATSTVQNPVITYTTSGVYKVTLVASNTGGDSNPVTKTDFITVVIQPLPVADFTSDSSSVTEEETVTFSDLSTETPIGWQWTFEGGSPNTSTEQNPVVTYPTVGSYSVTLVTTNYSGDSAPVTKTDYITVAPYVAPIDKSLWTIEANTSSEPASNAIDDDVATIWHSIWPYVLANRGPHVLTLDLSVENEVNGVSILCQRSNSNKFRPKHIIIERSDDGITWIATKSISIPTLEEAKEFDINFDSAVVTRYLKIAIDEVYSANWTDNLYLTEIDIF